MSFEYLLVYSQTLAFMFVAVASFMFIINQRIEQKRTKLRESAQFLSTYTKGMIIPLDSIRELSPEKFVDININETESRHKKIILEFLNSYEFISLNIERNIIDESLAQEFMLGNLKNSFKILQPHIIAIRESTNNSRLYAKFESIARKWDSLK